MKRFFAASLTLSLLWPAAAALAADRLVPAGSLIQCTLSEPKLSSKTVDVGDPVLCQVSHVELFGRSVFPYGSYLEGRFEDYKDPGHFVGKGWMELKFDRMIIEPDTVLPVAAKVVDVPGFVVDHHGRILGKGHAVRDTIEWMIPILWPIDLINLPRRGPRPTLKEETRLTLKVMDDFGMPDTNAPAPVRDDSGLMRRAPVDYQPPAPPPPPPQPVVQTYVQPVYVPRPYVYGYVAVPAPWAGPRTVTVWRNGYAYRTVVP